MRRRCLPLVLAISLALTGLSTLADDQTTSIPEHNAIDGSLSPQSIVFTQNQGQWPDSILFRATAGSTTLWFTADGLYYQFIRATASAGSRPDQTPFRHPSDLSMSLVKAQFAGCNLQVTVRGLDEQAYRCNYFVGSDPGKWRTNIPTYAAVSFADIYPGVTAVFRGQAGRLSYELHGSAAALAQARIAFSGGTISTDNQGITTIQTTIGEKKFNGMLPLTDSSPVESFVIPSEASGATLVYSTYLGGVGGDYANDIAVNAAGNAYVAGFTASADFPTKSPYQTYQALTDITVTEFSASGTSLIFSTYLGGNSHDFPYGIALDSAGNIYVTGETVSSNYPTQGPYQTYQGPAGYTDAFVSKLSPSGNALVYSTYLGGNDADRTMGLAVDALGSAYVTGHTKSSNYPTRNAYQSYQGPSGNWDSFITKLNPSGNDLVYSTYVGGNGDDVGLDITIDPQKNAYIVGYTKSTNYPTQTPYQASLASLGYNDVFVTRLNPAGSTLGYSTYLGGGEGDFGYDVAVDSTGSAYVIGSTESNDFPTKTPFQTYRGPVGTVDVFVTRFTPAGDSLVYSTYLGGTDGNDEGTSIAIDASGSAFLTGYIGSSDFPTQNAFQTNFGGGTFDAFVTKLGAGGNSLTYSTYVGGGDSDQGMNIAIDNEGNAYVAGSTRSYDFPTRNPYQGTFNDVRDAFITKVSPKCCLGMRGNINMTGIIDLTDLSYLILYLTTLPTPTLLCPEAANIDGQGLIDLTDLSWLILYMTTLPTPTLPNCP